MYYEKVGLAYGSASGRQIEPDYPSSGLDIEDPKVDEFRIVAPSGLTVGISSIRAGTGAVSTSDVITVTTSTAITTGLDVDTPVTIRGISATGYNGKYVVTEKVSSTSFRYEVQNIPVEGLPSVTGSTVSLTPDSVTSQSPYINGVSMRSVYGMCGMHADGSQVIWTLSRWLLHSLLVLVFKKTRMRSLSITQTLVHMKIAPSLVMRH